MDGLHGGLAHDELGCGRIFALCRLHGLRGCVSCHACEPAPGPRERVRALMVRAWSERHLEHVRVRAALEELEHASIGRLRALVGDLRALPPVLAACALDVARELEEAA